MTKAVAIVLTYGRAALSELLAMVDRQTRPIDCLVYIDDAPWLNVARSAHVRAVHAPALVSKSGTGGAIGLIRRAAIEHAAIYYELRADDVIVMLDDDDFYSREHFARTLAPMDRGAEWTGALAQGLQELRGQTPHYCSGESGCGQQATWAFRLGVYHDAGGYLDELPEDVPLARRIGWERCTSHRHLTHVRRIHAANHSGRGNHDRVRMRARDLLCSTALPKWSDELDMLDGWCAGAV